MKSITVHGLDEELDGRIRSEAGAKGQSLNKTIKGLLRKALGIGEKPGDRRADFQDLFGTWSAEDQEVFNDATASFRTVDPEDWQ